MSSTRCGRSRRFGLTGPTSPTGRTAKRQTMKTVIATIVLLLLTTQAALAVRIKDIASFDGARDNQLIGYGLVVGLNGSGDSDQTKFPAQSLVNVLERMGVTINRADISVKNVAAVMVTAILPPFAK